MEAERILEQLAAATYTEWAPTVTATFTTGGDSSLANATNLWRVYLTHLYSHGAALLYGHTIGRAAAAFGASFPPPPSGAVLDQPPAPDPLGIDTARLEQKAERIVKRGLSLFDDTLTAAGRARLDPDPPYTIRQAQADYLRESVNRYQNVPDTVYRDITKDLDRGLAAGESPDVTAARIQDTIPRTGAKTARMIARTESAAAMTSATLEAAKHTSTASGVNDLFKTWVCVHPDTIVSASGVTHAARRRYKGPLYTVRTASGLAVSLTPEHEVLTGRGWIRAELLHESDHLFQIAGVDAASAPDVQDPPATIGQIVDAVMASETVQVRTVKHRVDLDVHNTIDGDVEVVTADSDLTISFQPSGSQRVEDFLFTDADRLGHAVMLSDRHTAQCVARFWSPRVGGGSSCGSACPDFVGFAGSPQLPGVRLVTDANASRTHDLSDLGRSASVSFPERARGLAREIGRHDLSGSSVKVVTVASFEGEPLSRPHLGDLIGTGSTHLPRLADGAQRLASGAEPAHDCRVGAAQICGDLTGSSTLTVLPDDFIDIEFDHDRQNEDDGCNYLTADRIHSIERSQYDGFVYDLSTVGHWYSANGLVVHNCTTDSKTRRSHRDANMQRVPVDGKFHVGGFEVDHPGDGPPAISRNCRCAVIVLTAREHADMFGEPEQTVTTQNPAPSAQPIRKSTVTRPPAKAPKPQSGTGGGDDGGRKPPFTGGPSALGPEPDPADRDAYLAYWKKRQDALPVDFKGDTLQSHEVRFVERFLAAGETLEWIPKANHTSTNDFTWTSKGGLPAELKSPKARYETIRGRITDAVSKARKQGVVKENFVIDIGDHELSDDLRTQLEQFNVGRRDKIARLWVMTLGELIEIPLAT